MVLFRVFICFLLRTSIFPFKNIHVYLLDYGYKCCFKFFAWSNPFSGLSCNQHLLIFPLRIGQSSQVSLRVILDYIPDILNSMLWVWILIKSFCKCWSLGLFVWVKWSEVKSFSRVRLFATPWTVVYQAPPSTRFFRQEYWSRLPFPSPGDLPDSGIKPGSPALQVDSLTSELPGK